MTSVGGEASGNRASEGAAGSTPAATKSPLPPTVGSADVDGTTVRGMGTVPGPAAPADGPAPAAGTDATPDPDARADNVASPTVAVPADPGPPAPQSAASTPAPPSTQAPPRSRRPPGIDGPTTAMAPADTAAQAGRTTTPPPSPTGRPAARRPGPGAPAGPRRPGPPGGRSPASGAPVGGPPMPGTLISDRYRLVTEVGRDAAADAALWKARDVMLERDVAVTLLVGNWQADTRASGALSRATRSAHFEHPHAARVLDVVRPGAANPLPAGVLGAAVAEWTPGRDLAELVAGGPLRPSVALRVIEPLADAVAAAHRSGLVLGLDHPQRVRVSNRAATRLAFPMPRGEATNADDVHGLGALLYLLLTARWPGADGTRPPAGLRAAPHGPDGGAVPARQLRPDLPVELAALVDRTLDADGGIRTAAAVHRLVTQMREGLEDDAVLLPVLEDGQTIDPDDAGEVWHDDAAPEPAQDPARRRNLRIGVTALVVATLAIIGFVAFQIVSVVAGGGASAPPIVVIPAETAAPAPAPGAPSPQPAAPAAAPGGPVQLSSVAVYSPAGDPDNPTRIDQAADNNDSTTWSTSEYRQQLPALKPGIGMMTTFTAPSTVSAVTVRSPSPGTRIEVRSAPAANVPLAQTQLLGTGTVVGNELRITLQPAPPTGNLLLWITGLGQQDGRYVSELAEVVVERPATG